MGLAKCRVSIDRMSISGSSQKIKNQKIKNEVASSKETTSTIWENRLSEVPGN
jgi:hypothetical protein